MKITRMTLGDYATNCYIVSDDQGVCAVIDPGYTPEKILAKIKELGLTVGAILLTHGHFDHIGGVQAIAEETDCRVYVHPAEKSLPPCFVQGTLYYTDFYRDGDTVKVGDLTFEVLETPGHTMGSVCLLCEDAMFSGDTLFARSCGRTDMGGDWDTILKSLHRLSLLEKDYQIYPGHGAYTTLAQEKKYNSYMK